MLPEELKQLESDRAANYHTLNQIYGQMLANDANSLSNYPINYLMPYLSLKDYVQKRMLKLARQETNPRQQVGYWYQVLSYSLFSGDIEQYNKVLQERTTLPAKGTALGLDFNPLNGLTVIADNDTLTVIADSDADLAVCRLLAAGLGSNVKKVFPPFLPKPQIFMLRGKGASPFNAALNCAFLMVGHYQGTSYEQEHFATSVLHELTHLWHQSIARVRFPQSLTGEYKFFDEGLAVNNSNILNPGKSSLFCQYYNSSVLLHKYSGLTISNIMQSWFDLLFNKPWLPTYDYACTFIEFIDDLRRPIKHIDTHRNWLRQTQVSSPYQYLCQQSGYSKDKLEELWVQHLNKGLKGQKVDTSTTIELVEMQNGYAKLRHQSTDYLALGKNIFCIHQGQMLRPYTDKSSSYRYNLKANFYAELPQGVVPAPGQLQVYVLYKGTYQEFRF